MSATDVFAIPDALLCMVCGGAIPAKRATQKDVKTCSDVCTKRFRRFRSEQMKSFRCPVCLRPSSEEEREEFRQWRRTKGPLQGFLPSYAGNGSAYTHIAELRKELADVLVWLKKDLDEVVESNGVLIIDGQLSSDDPECLAIPLVEEMMGRIGRVEKLLGENPIGRKKKAVDIDLAG